MALDNAVLSLVPQAEYQGLTDSQAATLANTKSITRTDSTLKNSRAIIHVVGVTKAQQLYSALGTANLQLVQELLGSDGIDFSSAQTQGMIDQLVQAGAFSSQDGAALKAIGVWQITPYANAGGTGDCTSEQWATARKYATLRSHASQRYNEAVDAIEAGTVADLAALKAILGA